MCRENRCSVSWWKIDDVSMREEFPHGVKGPFIWQSRKLNRAARRIGTLKFATMAEKYSVPAKSWAASCLILGEVCLRIWVLERLKGYKLREKMGFKENWGFSVWVTIHGLKRARKGEYHGIQHDTWAPHISLLSIISAAIEKHFWSYKVIKGSLELTEAKLLSCWSPGCWKFKYVLQFLCIVCKRTAWQWEIAPQSRQCAVKWDETLFPRR